MLTDHPDPVSSVIPNHWRMRRERSGEATEPEPMCLWSNNVYGVTTKSERYERSYWTRTAAGNGIGGRKAPVPYGS